MALTQTRRRQIQDALRSLQGRVKQQPELQKDIEELNAKLQQDNERPVLPERQTLEPEEPVERSLAPTRPTTEDVSAGADPNFNPVNPFSSGSSGNISFERQSSPSFFSDFQKEKKEREKQEKLKEGATEVFQNQLESLRSENQAFRASLSEEIGITGLDELITGFEDQAGLLIDREDQENKALLVDLANSRKTGILNETEFQEKLGNIVSEKGKSVELLGQDAEIPGGELPQLEELEAPTGEEPQRDPLQFDLPGLPGQQVLAEDVTQDTQTDVVSYTNPDSGLIFEASPESPSLDLSKFTDDDWKNLDSMQLLQAEMNLSLSDLDERDNIDDAFFQDSQALLKKVHEDSFNFTTALLETEKESLAIQKADAQDELFFADLQNEMDRSNALEDTYIAQAKAENYLKGKLSAFGAGKSTAALSIMSNNSLKFARVRSRINAQSDLEARKIDRLSITTQRAYANTIMKLNINASKSIADLASNTQGNLLNLARQKLISDADKEKQRINLQLGYIKGIQGIESSKAQAEADAQKEQRAWFKDNIQMAGWMEKQTGTVWNVDASGQLYDTREESQKASIDRQKLEIARAKLAGRGGGGGGGGGAGKKQQSESEIVAYIEAARASGLGDQEIMNTLSVSGPLVGGGETGAKITRFSERYINTTAQPIATESEIPFVNIANSLLGLNIPTKRTTFEPAPFVLPKEKASFEEQLTSQLTTQTEILKEIEAKK